ncbi:hypothetical protein LY90DRAFT_671888 [Neocallimastix californiae]|uniref:MATH domain-containing protein n=1 Tax=Neocallimastix californiae TaxID=1754190 RepID=A0A1Y2C5V0_9FUNG|nr:hypothetical protein LY90DRAFT_671888 [Neocallimastix californiae]|eukprot:ORY42411.1 hypothetical protein LY90DRAFT_671888 [Neocallimastix californiae]
MNKKSNILQEDFYEWEIEGWNVLPDEMSSPIFIAVNHKWKILFYPKKRDKETQEDYISVGIEVLDISKDMETENIHMATDFVFSIRNSNDYFCFIAVGYGQHLVNKQPFYFSINKKSCGIEWFTSKEELYKKDKSYNKSIIENNKAILDTYICSYEYNKERYIEELQSLMTYDTDEKNDKHEKYFEQELNVLRLNNNRRIKFESNNYKWKISLYPNEKNKEYISLKIKINDLTSKEEEEACSVSASFVFSFRNIKRYSCFWAKGTSIINFNEDTEEYEVAEFIKKDNLFNEYRRNTINKLTDDNDKVMFGVLSYVVN